MSQLSLASITSPVYSFTFGPMLIGSVINPNAIPDFRGACSKILGCVRTTTGGVPGQPYYSLVAALVYPQMTLRSSSATDTSTYTIFWENSVATSSSIAVLGC